MYISDDFTEILIHTSSIRHNALHDLTFNRLPLASWVQEVS